MSTQEQEQTWVELTRAIERQSRAIAREEIATFVEDLVLAVYELQKDRPDGKLDTIDAVNCISAAVKKMAGRSAGLP